MRTYVSRLVHVVANLVASHFLVDQLLKYFLAGFHPVDLDLVGNFKTTPASQEDVVVEDFT